MIVAVDGNYVAHMFYAVEKSAAQKDKRRVILESGTMHFHQHLAQLENYCRNATWGDVKLKFIVAFDGRGSFRKDLVETYKANREKDEDAYKAISEAKRWVDETPRWIKIEAPPKFEGDDVLASIAYQSEDKVLIYTVDKDLNQCLEDGRVGIIKRFGLTDGGLTARNFTEAKLRKEFGIGPERWVDFQCMTGDSVDNIKGWPGVGKVAAKKILRYHEGPIEDLDPNKARLDGVISAKQRTTWDEFYESLPELRQLLGLVKTIPLKAEKAGV